MSPHSGPGISPLPPPARRRRVLDNLDPDLAGKCLDLAPGSKTPASHVIEFAAPQASPLRSSDSAPDPPTNHPPARPASCPRPDRVDHLDLRRLASQVLPAARMHKRAPARSSRAPPAPHAAPSRQTGRASPLVQDPFRLPQKPSRLPPVELDHIRPESPRSPRCRTRESVQETPESVSLRQRDQIREQVVRHSATDSTPTVSAARPRPRQ